ncbi:MAG: hypothetical protein HY675_28610 [Chloroflexi bacterium]|nr:hypothetical protein [Chloroflexota bacterium]
MGLELGLRVRALLVSFWVLILMLLSTAAALAESPLPVEWDIPKGHFYTQANGFPVGSSPSGFSITDDGDVLFWTEFRRLGGMLGIGYPVSRRFLWNGFVSQATQKGVLQWRPDQKKAWFVNVFDLLHDAGKDDWLALVRSVPKQLPSDFDKGKSWNDVIVGRRALLNDFPKISARYESAADPLSMFGLPTSRVQDMGNAYVVRLQRTVIQQWKVDVPWAKSGDVSIANGGDVAKEMGLLPKNALYPHFAPENTWKMSTLYRVKGISTWYGQQYHGRVMANGQRYDMNDPTTVASNMFPFGTKLKVTRAKTGASITVVVKDTGDFSYPIVVDLSLAAFARLADPREGVMEVSVEVAP